MTTNIRKELKPLIFTIGLIGGLIYLGLLNVIMLYAYTTNTPVLMYRVDSLTPLEVFVILPFISIIIIIICISEIWKDIK